MLNILNRRRAKKRRRANKLEVFLLLVIIALVSVNIKIFADLYIVFTDTHHDEPIVREPIGFVKCPKNKKSEGLYCPIYPKETPRCQ